MIPKTIHYCWFGGNPLTDMARKCIESWKEKCPDYEIVEWNEKNFDVNSIQYVKEAYENKKWAFVSDVARLYALVEYGGIYMDTDVEVIKPLDSFLDCVAFSGFESNNFIPTGSMACEKGYKLFSELLDDYKERKFVLPNGEFDMTTNTVAITEACKKRGLILNNQYQIVEEFSLYPSEYFCPKEHATGKMNLTSKTYTIHHFEGSWLSDEQKYQKDIMLKLCKRISEKNARRISHLMSIYKFHGIREIMKFLRIKIHKG